MSKILLQKSKEPDTNFRILGQPFCFWYFIMIVFVFVFVENQAQLVWTCAYEEMDNVWKSVWAHFIVIRVVVEC